jgi:hypothetical protein
MGSGTPPSPGTPPAGSFCAASGKERVRSRPRAQARVRGEGSIGLIVLIIRVSVAGPEPV